MASPLLGKREREQPQHAELEDLQLLQPHKRFLGHRAGPEVAVLHEISDQEQQQQQELALHQQQQELLGHHQQQQQQQQQQEQELALHQQQHELLRHQHQQHQHQHQQQPSTCTDIVLYRPVAVAPEVLAANPALLGALCGAAGSDSSSTYQLPSAVAPDTAQLKAVWHSLTPAQRKSLRGAWAALREGGRSGSLPLRRLGSSQALPAPASCVIEELPDGSDDAPAGAAQQQQQQQQQEEDEAGVDAMMTDEPGGGQGLAPAGSVEEMEM